MYIQLHKFIINIIIIIIIIINIIIIIIIITITTTWMEVYREERDNFVFNRIIIGLRSNWLWNSANFFDIRFCFLSPLFVGLNHAKNTINIINN